MTEMMLLSSDARGEEAESAPYSSPVHKLALARGYLMSNHAEVTNGDGL